MALLFAGDGDVVGFGGSQVNGRVEIEAVLGSIVADRPTPAYVGIVWEVSLLGPDVAVLRAAAGMVPDHPATRGRWRIGVCENTPAAFHGRPQESDG